MILWMSIGAFTLLHVVITLVAIGGGLIVVGGMLASIITGAATREARWDLIIAALHFVFGSIRWRLTPTQLQSRLLWRRRSTGRRLYGGPATMIMRPVNGGVGVPSTAGMGGVPGITATEGQRDSGRSSVLS